MPNDLAELLVSPNGGQELELSGSDLVAKDGGRFPVVDGVARMVTVSGENPENEDWESTAETFGGKWELFTDEQREKLAEFQYEWFNERFGWTEEELADHLNQCQSVLDAGTGTGYDAARYARHCPGDVIGLDLSNSVARAADYWSDVQNLTFVQGDIMSPPFSEGQFDLVVADQVIHHTPDCRKAFASLARLVAPGGQLLVYVYRKKAFIRELADEHLREVTTALPFDECMSFCEDITELGRQLSETEATVTLERGVPLLGIEPGEHDVQRLIYWCFLKCFWNPEWGEEMSVLTNFDWYHPPYASRHTREEVQGWVEEDGLETLVMHECESGISVRALKPN